MPKISVCVAYHNMGDLFPELVDSILDQSFKDWELLICDNNSLKEEQTKLDKILEKLDCDVHLTRKGNIGTYAARWVNYEKAKGDIIVSPDADDTYPNKNFFSELVKIYEDKDVDLVRYNYTRLFGSDIPDVEIPELYTNAEPKEALKLFKKLVFDENIFNSLGITSFRRSLLKDSKQDKNLYMRYLEDDYLVLDLLDRAKGMAFTNKVYYYYRVNDQSVSSTVHHDDRYRKDYIENENLRLKTAKQWGIEGYEQQSNYNFLYKNVIMPVLLLTNTEMSHSELVDALYDYYHKIEPELKNHDKDDKNLRSYERLLLNLFYAKRMKMLAAYLTLYTFFDKNRDEK